ncbi:pre-toxin TG domain-containing protein [Krasilnikovia sp. M28-CT-15]|uniref:pre-toxin TG domain-containing protein n=1 Tax=Krasilnikovia sp. M28-CT-15 TaxID=3373540 RepID=UPI00399D4722
MAGLQKCVDDVVAPGGNADSDTWLQKLGRLSKFRACAEAAGFPISAALECVDKSTGDTLSARYEQIKQCLIETQRSVGVAAMEFTLSGYTMDVFRDSLPELNADAAELVADIRDEMTDGQQNSVTLKGLLDQQAKVTDPATIVAGLPEAIAQYTAWMTDSQNVVEGWREDLQDRYERLQGVVEAIRYAVGVLADLRDKIKQQIPSLDALVQKATDAIQKFSTVLGQLNDIYETLTQAASDATRLMDEMNASLAEANRGLDKMNAAMGQVNRGLNTMNEGIAGANRGMDQLNGAIAGWIRNLDRMNAAIAGANRGMDQMNAAVAGMPNITKLLGSGVSLKGFLDNVADPSVGLPSPEQRLQQLSEQQQRDAGMSLILDLMPGIGDAKGVVEGFTGKDMATGEQLNGVERSLGALFLLHHVKSLGKGADVVRGTDKLNKAFGSLRNAKGAVTALRTGGKLPAGWTTRRLPTPPAGKAARPGVTWTEAVYKDGGRLVYTSDGGIYVATDEGLEYLGSRKLSPVKESCLNSFRADTRVLLPGGRTAAIQDIQRGQEVLAGNPGTHTTVAALVRATPTHVDTVLTDLTLGDGSVLHTTAQHWFWEPLKRTWAQAADLTPGTALSSPGGIKTKVRSVHTFTGAQRMYNLTVARRHTFYVQAQGTPVLVHNCPMKRAPKVLRAVKLPGRMEGVDIKHIRDGHVKGGKDVKPDKGLWPDDVTDAEINRVANEAFRNNRGPIGWDSETRMIQAQARVGGKLYEFIINKDTGVMRTIYPKR